MAKQQLSQKPAPLYIICGMMANKDAFGFLRPLSSHVTELMGVEVIGEDSHPAEKIVEFAKRAGITATTSPSVEQALREIAAKDNGKMVRVLICGALYLAGKILKQNDLLPD